MDILNVVFALLSVGLGLIGWLAPRYTMNTLDLHAGQTPMGISEIRAASGALFVGMGCGALYLGTPAGFAMLGFCWAGAGIGRLTSLTLDGATPKKWIFLVIEAVIGLGAIFLNV